jgi:hypothetical protein
MKLIRQGKARIKINRSMRYNNQMVYFGKVVTR